MRQSWEICFDMLFFQFLEKNNIHFILSFNFLLFTVSMEQSFLPLLEWSSNYIAVETEHII